MSVTQLERWLDKREIAAFFGCSVSWIEYRVSDGMPSAMIAGRRKFRAGEVEDWLEKEGFLQKESA